ncbi:unnamed protein product, partial [Didymodactylos carnosus]
ENRNTTPNSSPVPRSPIHESPPHLYLPDVESHRDLYHDADAMTVATQITIDSDETRTTVLNEKEAPDATNENNLNKSKTVVDVSSMLAQSPRSSSSSPFLPESHASQTNSSVFSRPEATRYYQTIINSAKEHAGNVSFLEE